MLDRIYFDATKFEHNEKHFMRLVHRGIRRLKSYTLMVSDEGIALRMDKDDQREGVLCTGSGVLPP